MHQSLRFTAAVAAALLLGPTGCSTGDAPGTGGSSESPQSSGASTDVDPRPLAHFFNFVDYRYVEFEEVSQLADASPTEAVVRGTVGGFEPGPAYYDDAGTASGANMVMSVNVTDAFEGDVPAEVHVLLPAGERTVEDFEATLPLGSEVVLYLDGAHDLPAEQADEYMVPVSAQGFIVGESDDTGVVYPLAHSRAPRETLAGQVP